MKRSLLALVFAVVALGLFLWRGSGSPDSAPAIPEPTASAEAADAGAEVELDEATPIASVDPAASALARESVPSERVLAEGLPLRAVLLDDGDRPVRGALYLRRIDENGQPVGSTRVERTEDGALEIPDLARGTWRLVPVVEGLTYSHGPRDVRVPTRVEQRFRLTTLSVISGIVLDPEGRPVEGAIVSQHDEHAALAVDFRSDPRPSGPREHLTYTGGRFRIRDLSPGTYVLRARTPAWAGSDDVSITLGPAEEREVEIRLRPTGRIEGHVVSTTGEGLGGWTVTASGEGPRSERHSRVTGGNGEFAMEDLEPGAYLLKAVPPSLAGSAEPDELADSLDSIAPENRVLTPSFGKKKMREEDPTLREEVTVQGGRTTTVRIGRVFGRPVRALVRVKQAGEPQGGLEVQMFPFPDDPWNPRYTQAAVTDESGTCSLELPGPGDYQMLVWSESRSLFHRFALVPEVVQHEIEVDLPTSGIRGTVHHVDKTWFGFTVRAARLGDDDVTHRNASDTTKNDGLFEIDWLPAGRYLVTAGVVTVERTHAPLGIGRAAFQEVELEEGEVLELHFEIERGVVEGEVVDLSGEPLGRADILIVHPSGVLLGTGVADKDGKFSVNAPTGRVAIAARTSKLASSRWTMLDLPADASRSVRLELVPSTVVELTAVDATGSEVSAWIRVFDGNGMDRSDERPDTESRRVDLRGPFPPGTYTIRAVAPDGRRAERVVEFDGRGYVHVEVTLP